MRGILFTFFPLALLTLSLTAPDARADMLFKRIKCKDASEAPNGLLVFHNQAGFSKYITVRITRDGCRPKGALGSYAVIPTDYYETVVGSGSSVTRMGRSTTSVFRDIPAGQVARIKFSHGIDAKPSGTFDLHLEVD